MFVDVRYAASSRPSNSAPVVASGKLVLSCDTCRLIECEEQRKDGYGEVGARAEGDALVAAMDSR